MINRLHSSVASLNSNRNFDNNRLNVNGNNWNDNNNGYAFGMTRAPKALTHMKSYRRLYENVISFENLILAWKKARTGKTKKAYVIEFEREVFHQLMALHYELAYGTYRPKPLQTFILRDPKTRTISKSDFRDRVVHHALVNVLEPIFDKTFIYDSCANRKGKGNLMALQRFDYFRRKVSRNGLVAKNTFKDANYVTGYCLKADIKHYFEEVNHAVLMHIITRKIRDIRTLTLICYILNNAPSQAGGGGRTGFGSRCGYAARQSHVTILCQLVP